MSRQDQGTNQRSQHLFPRGAEEAGKGFRELFPGGNLLKRVLPQTPFPNFFVLFASHPARPGAPALAAVGAGGQVIQFTGKNGSGPHGLPGVMKATGATRGGESEARAERDSYIRVEHVTRVYERESGPVYALRGVSFTVGRGELVGLMGPSGSGKSTLLNLLGGLDRPNEGRVVVEATDIAKLSSDALALYRRDRIGFVFQSSYLIGALTVYENVALPLVPLAISEEEKKERVERALEECNIAHRASHLPGELSGGEQQRAAVARALVNDPELVLADEPTGELDPENADRVLELLTHIGGGRRTVVIASHDAGVLARLPRILKLREGELEADERR